MSSRYGHYNARAALSVLQTQNRQKYSKLRPRNEKKNAPLTVDGLFWLITSGWL